MKNNMYKQICHSCGEKHKEYRPIKYGLGRCEICGTYTGVAEVEYRPEVIDELFGNLNK
jgi:rRNA maturation endonuclease Nob1